jgi:hypothetical protein
VSHAEQATAANGREAAIALEDERRSAKHQLRPNIGLSGSSNEVPVKMQYERMALGSRGGIWYLPFKVEQPRTASLDPFHGLTCTVGELVIAVNGNAEVFLTVCGKPCCAYFTAQALQMYGIDWTCQSHRAMSLFMLDRGSKLIHLLEQISVCPRYHMSTRAT